MKLSKNKIGMLIIAFLFFTLLFAIIGTFAGGAVYFKLTKISLSHLEISSLYKQWLTYKNNEDVRPYLSVGILVNILVSLLPLFISILVIINSRPKEELHGSARFANDKDLSESGFFPDRSKDKSPAIILGKVSEGKFKNRFIELTGQLFAYVSAPTRSGKGVGIVLPNCITFPDSMVCTDIKYENFIKSAGFRKKHGQEVYLFSPDGYGKTEDDKTNELISSHRWNCYDYVRRSNTYRVGDILTITRSLYPRTGDKNDIWNGLAGKLFTGLSLWMLDSESITGVKPSLPYLYKLVGVEGGLRSWMKRECQAGYVSNEAKTEFNVCLDMAEETYSSVQSNLLAPLDVFSDKVVAESVSTSDFDFRELRKKKMTIYVGCQPNKLPVFEKLFNIFFEQLIAENTRTLPEHDDTLKYQCLLILDEFTSLGRIKQIEKAISYAAGYNLRFLLIFQDFNQMDDIYGDKQGDNIRKNHAVHIVYPPKKVDAHVKSISETLGSKTIKKRKVSRSTGKSSSRTISYEEQKRQLMMPFEIVELSYEKHPVATKLGTKTLIIAENQRPFKAEKAFFFDEKHLLERVEFSMKNIPEIPLLNLT